MIKPLFCLEPNYNTFKLFDISVHLPHNGIVSNQIHTVFIICSYTFVFNVKTELMTGFSLNGFLSSHIKIQDSC